jgi:hypothetical protein
VQGTQNGEMAMRARLCVVIMAAVAVLAAGCGTLQAPAVALSAAVANTAATTSRVAVSTTMSGPGMTTTITATGEFDYAHPRGVLRMGGGLGPGGVEVRYLPPQLYVKFAGAAGMPVPEGKSWVEISLPGQAAAESLPFLPLGNVHASPMDLLAALTAMASKVTDLGPATIRGVAVTHYRVTVDLAKAEAHQQPQARAEFHSFASSLDTATLPVDVWVDGQARVRRIAISLPMPPGSGMPAGLRVSEAVDYYDFGVPVRVSAPPASEVMSASQVSQSMSSSGSGSGRASPPPVSGTLSAAQATAAEQAVRAFWTALSSNSAQAVERTVVPSQRSCVAGFVQGSKFKFKISSLRITAAKPAGTGRATVWFSVNATVQMDGQTVPMAPSGAAGTTWLQATEIGSVWYADPSNSGWGVLPPCLPVRLNPVRTERLPGCGLAAGNAAAPWQPAPPGGSVGDRTGADFAGFGAAARQVLAGDPVQRARR